MKWPQLVAVLLSVLAVAFAVRSRQQRTAAAASTTSAPAPTSDLGRAFPPSFERPGLVSRQIGLLRVYVTVLAEIPLAPPADGSARRVDTVPILLTFENDTYQPLAASSMGWLDGQMGIVRVTRTGDEREVDVFQHEVPSPARADWLSAERRSVTVDWPVRDATPGTYRITLQLALPEQPPLEITTRLL